MMKIDKKRFLALTSGLAAASAAALIACSSTTTKTDNPNNGNGDSGTTTDSGETTDSGGGTDSGNDAAACLSDKGAAPICTAEGLTDGGADADADIDGGDAAAPMESACPAECTQAKTNFKSDVAAAVDTCLGNATTSCDGNTLPDCIDKALDKTCDDATVKDFCSGLVNGCYDAGTGDAAATKPLTQADCEKLAKGLNDTGRATFTGCVQEGLGCDMAADCIAQIKSVPPI